ncbi:MAG: PQQ-binding-like beta-propeller repeat protein [Polyangiaceae bacterium]
MAQGKLGPPLSCPGDESVRGCWHNDVIASESRVFSLARSTGPGPAVCMLTAFDAGHLARVWSRALDVDCESRLAGQGSRLFVASARRIIALDAGSGAEAWRSEAIREVGADLVADDMRVLSIERSELIVHNAASGAVEPSVRGQGRASYVVLRDGVAYVSGSRGAATGALVWAIDLGKPTLLCRRPQGTLQS